MMCQCTSRLRTAAASRIQRDVSQAHGHSGSNQKSARVVARPTAAVPSAESVPAGAARSSTVCGDVTYVSTGKAVLSRPYWANAAAPPADSGQRPSPGSCHTCVRDSPTRPDQTRPDPTRPDQTRPDQTRPEGAYRSVAAHNLTRAEAGERARLITVQSNTVELDVTDGPGDPGAATFVDLTAPAVPEVTLNGRSLDPDLVFDGFRVAVDGLAADNELRVVADGAYMRTGEGLHRFVDPVDGEVYLYTQFETFDAHRIYACFDQPDLKAVFDLTVTAPTGWHVVSNGAATATPGPAAAQVVRFAPTPRISTYITALVAGPYHRVTDEHDGIPLGIYCRRSLAEHIDAERIFTETKQGFDFYHRVFDYRYPFGKYDQLFVPEFNAGAMENAAAVTFLEDYVFRSKVTRASYERRAETILHEMAHMWFGDLVTMRWWDDLW